MGSVAWVGVSSFFFLDDLKMSLFLYKLGNKLLQVSDVCGIYIQLCVFYIMYLKTIRIFVNLWLWAVMCQHFCFCDVFTILPSHLEFLRPLYPKRVLSDFKGIFPNDLCCPEVADASNFTPKDTGMQS